MNCPACEADLDLDEEILQEGGIIRCEDCGTACEVVNLHPLELEQMHGDDDDEEDPDKDDDGFDDEDEDDEDDDFDDQDEDEDLDRNEDEDEE